MEKQLQQKFSIMIHAHAMSKVKNWVRLASPDEVSALGTVDELWDDDNSLAGFLITEVFLLDQTCNIVETSISDEAISKLMIDLSDKGHDLSTLKCWIHSHGKMGVFWSNTDDECCEKLANNSYTLSIVTNLRGEILCRLDIYNPVHVTLDELPVQVYYPEEETLSDWCRQEFERKVKKEPAIVRRSKRKNNVPEFGTLEEMEEAFQKGEIDFDDYYSYCYSDDDLPF